MSGDDEVSKKLPDGSVSIWCRGWVITFPPDGGEPTFAKEDAPVAAEADDLDGLRVAPVGDQRGIHFGHWLVLVPAGGGEPVVVSGAPKDDGTGEGFFIRRRSYYQ